MELIIYYIIILYYSIDITLLFRFIMEPINSRARWN